jgi:hypothetical protein
MGSRGVGESNIQCLPIAYTTNRLNLATISQFNRAKTKVKQLQLR